MIIEGLLLNATNLCWGRKHVPKLEIAAVFAAGVRRESALRTRGAVWKEM